MSLYLQVSNSLSALARRMCLQLQAQENGVFQPFYIVTQTEGMNNWLKLQMSACMGIAANYRFLKPNDIIFDVYQLLGGRYTQSMAPESLTWLLYKLLNDSYFTARFKSVASYYAEGADKDVKRLALAEKLADLLDQYQIYRPEMIRRWNEAELSEVGADDWQMYLWIKAREISKGMLPDRTQIGQYVLDALARGEHAGHLKDHIPAVHIFGLSVITAYHLQLFSALAPHLDFYFHILNPAPSEYWFEDRSEKQLAFLKKKGWAEPHDVALGNQLLVSWGRLIQNTFSLFFQQEELINSYEEVEPEPPGDSTLLHRIQQDIFYNRSKEDRLPLSAAHLADGSLSVNACYTPAREVEALYNYLVQLIDKRGEKISARDIVVMVSDIDTYAPYIRAVFNNAPYKFYYTIADESFIASDSVSSALHSVLKMNRSTFKAEEVLQLLDSAFIRRRFGISDVDLIRRVVKRAGIRFGIYGDKSDDTRYVSWKYGISRILYGLCVSGDEKLVGEDGEVYHPLDIVEGLASAELVRFAHFIEILIHSVNVREQDRSLAEWIHYIEWVLHNLIFEPGDDANEDYDSLLKQLEQYNTLSALLPEKISFDVFAHNFLHTLTGGTRASAFAAGGITFCSLIPMRSIPFQVVAMLGLNFDKFPRKEVPSGFSLIEKEKRKGDRNVRENDKHLFLETLLSARKYLYLSYVGQSVKDNTPLPPSLMVDELVDYIEEGLAVTHSRPAVIRKHPLHNFSRRYLDPHSGLYNYLNSGGGEELNIFTGDGKEEGPVPPGTVNIESFVNFFKNPFKSYYNEVLGIYLSTEELLLSVTEVFELDGLQQWQLKKSLLEVDEAHQLEDIRTQLVRTAALPLKHMSDIAIQSLEKEVAPVRQLFREQTSGAVKDKIEISLSLAGRELKGELHNLYGSRIVELSWSKNEVTYLQEAYLRYLILRAAGYDHQLMFISALRGQVFRACEISTAEATERLSALLGLYEGGHQRILGWYPRIADSPAAFAKLNAEKFSPDVDKVLNGYGRRCKDSYVMKEYDQGFFRREQAWDDFREVAERLLLPLKDVFSGYYQ